MPVATEAPTFYTYPTAFGPVTIGAAGGAITAVVLGEARLAGEKRASAATNRCATEVMEYLAGKRTAFTVACEPTGTPFQRSVWEAAARIPYGQVRTAREVASALGVPEAYRAVGAALRKSPLALIVPAHRVVNAKGAASSPQAAALIALERRGA